MTISERDEPFYNYAVEIIKALGLDLIPGESNWYAVGKKGDSGVMISWQTWKKDPKLNVSASFPTPKPGQTAPRFSMPCCTISMGRDPAKAAKDIERKVIEPAKDIVKKILESYAAQDSSANDYKQHCADFAAAFPDLTMSERFKGESSKISDNNYNRLGEITSNGLYMEFRRNVTLEQFRQIVDILKK